MTEPATHPPISWVTTILFSTTFVAAAIGVPIYGAWIGYSVASWAWFAAFLVASGLSITAGYHRLWSHRSYEAHPVLRLFFMVFGAMAIQNSIYVWAAGHRPHHRFVDDLDRDPYSSRRGMWFSHIGWMLRRYESGEPDFKYVKDLESDPIVMFQHRHYVPIVLAMNIALPVAVGALSGDVIGTVLLAGLLRLVINHHVTFFINSLAHGWGRQPYTDANSSRDNGLLALVTYGEGYHNFHHLFSTDYRNGVRWWQWDPTKWLIRGLSFVGLTSKLRKADSIAIERARLDMQFKAANDSVTPHAERGDSLAVELRDLIRREYDAFTATLAEWSAIREKWIETTREHVAEHLERFDLSVYAREIEVRLRAQRHRVAQLAARSI